MKSPAAFQATYADWRLVKGRKVCQIILEVPLEAANSVLDVLGGMPDPAQSLWLGVARLNGNPELPSPSSHQTSPGNFDATGGVSPPLPGTDGRKPGTQSRSGRAVEKSTEEGSPGGTASKSSAAGGSPAQPRSWSSMSPAQQAGIRCNEPPFHLFLAERYAVNIRGSIDAVAFVRAHCRVASRADMNADHSAALLWRQLDSEFSTWKHHPEMVP